MQQHDTYQYNLALKFEAIADQYAKKTALRYPDGAEVSFSELNTISTRLAVFLKKQGYCAGDVVAIFNEKSVLGYALLLACLKTGIIYTNLDAASPWLRIKKILSTCKPRAVFYDVNPGQVFPEIVQEFSAINIHLLNESDINQTDTTTHEQQTINSAIHGSMPAYIMFTSGSTGFPKGAVMTHQNLLNFIEWGNQTFSVKPEDIFTNANPIYFDNSVFDFYVSIFNGATLVPLSHELVKNPKELVAAINESKCTIWFSVPSLLVYLLTTKTLSSDDFKSITRIAFGGEGFPKNKLRQLFNLYGHRVTLYNVYGPTECTCICSSYIISQADFQHMNELAPLGFMAPNFGYEILPLDEKNMNLGELCLTGPCVGIGYYNDTERTNASFVQNPKVGYRQTMYKTGDLVEKADNGHLHFKGRVDNQVKHMGYRIELEEVEAAFSSLPYINEVGVVYEKLNADLGQIKSFISLNDSQKQVSAIMNDIKMILPAYMLPRVIKVLPELPKNQNGKIDRKQLKELS